MFATIMSLTPVTIFTIFSVPQYLQKSVSGSPAVTAHLFLTRPCYIISPFISLTNNESGRAEVETLSHMLRQLSCYDLQEVLDLDNDLS